MKNYYISVDLGQAADFTAVAVIERNTGDFEDACIYTLGALEQVELGTAYPDIVEYVMHVKKSMVKKGTVDIIVDATGVGRPVVDMFKKAGEHVKPIVITGGFKAKAEDGYFHVPKRNLIMSLVLAFQNERFKINKRLKHYNTLRTELLNFDMKISKGGNDSFEGRAGKHDDMVLACAMAVYVGESTVKKAVKLAGVYGG